MEAIIYAAKSSEDKKGSIPTQLSDCRTMAESEAWTVVGEYNDESKSGWSGSRGDGLARAREHAERIAPCVLVVQHTDRLARGDAITATHLIEIVLWAMKSKVRLRSVQDDSTCENLVLAVIKGDQAHGESERKSKAVKSGKQRELEKGNWSGGTPWDGYASTGGKSARLYIDETRAPVIRRIFELALEGLTRPAIMRKMKAEGHRTRPVQRGTGKHHPTTGSPGTNTRVNQVLANPAYAGRHVLYRGTDHRPNLDPYWEAIIDPADFDRVQEKFRVRKEAEPRPEQGRPTSQYVLSHLAVCGKCGRPMYGETRRSPGKDGTRKTSDAPASAAQTGSATPRVSTQIG